VKRKDLIRKLEAAGFRLDRTGDHSIMKNKGAGLFKFLITVK